MALRAKMDWAIKGDVPTKYFFSNINPRNNRIKIKSI